ncbi:MAG TPA: peptide chain release factor N(5)-glutamine methyltransferase [Croceibacterium sp.]|nr:peptide chain release factor N(5)-glutamine methyltransferase [Croceibacterium sp.]
MKVSDALREAAGRLAATSDTARLDAELLMAEVLGVTRSDMLLRRMDDEAPQSYAALVERRAAHEPVAYIVGRKEFYGLELEVTHAVLIPRADSESLIEVAREAFVGRTPERILDLGTGSGALLLAALTVWPRAEGWGLDRSAEALFVAIRNAQRHANTPIAFVGGSPAELPPPRADRGFARFIQRDWRKRRWHEDLGRFDLVLCNPPYIEDTAELGRDVREWEPEGALFAGPDGLDDYRILIPQVPKLLADGGVAIFEIGATQAESVSAIAAAAGFASELRRDLAGRPRALVLRLGLGNSPLSDYL